MISKTREDIRKMKNIDMLIVFLSAAVFLSVIDIIGLKKKGQVKDIYVFIGLMLIAAGTGVWFFISNPKSSLAEMILRAFKIY